MNRTYGDHTTAARLRGDDFVFLGFIIVIDSFLFAAAFSSILSVLFLFTIILPIIVKSQFEVFNIAVT